MSKNLPVERLDEITDKPVTPVIPIWPSARETSNRLEKLSKEKAIKEMPFFYTTSIFKPKKHDPL